jgi:hypothetical protein
MPDVILISGGVPPLARGWLAAEYRETTGAAFARQDVRVFERAERTMAP